MPANDQMLLYHDEIPTTAFREESLSCRSAGASWHYPNGSTVAQFDRNSRNSYITQRTLGMDSRLRRSVDAEVPTEADQSTCRLESEAVSLGIYRRGRQKTKNLCSGPHPHLARLHTQISPWPRFQSTIIDVDGSN